MHVDSRAPAAPTTSSTSRPLDGRRTGRSRRAGPKKLVPTFPTSRPDGRGRTGQGHSAPIGGSVMAIDYRAFVFYGGNCRDAFTRYQEIPDALARLAAAWAEQGWPAEP